MPAKKTPPAFLIFDVESVADGELVSKIRYPGQALSPEDAIATYQDELLETKGTTFIPYTFQVPTAVVIAKVAKDGTLEDLVSLDEPAYRPHVMTQHFWSGWEAHQCPTWVTFNGRSFDLPLMELAAYRYGIPLGRWFGGSGYNAPRNRFNKDAHLDLQEMITNFGASRCNGGLNLIANLIAKPGKAGLTGDRVQGEYDEGNHQAIADYCRCDVLDTYFVFLRTSTLMGRWTLDHELELVCKAKSWLEDREDENEAYAKYLELWGEWPNPWKDPCDDSEGAGEGS